MPAADPTKPGRARQLLTVATFGSTFLVSLDSAIITTAMPTVVSQLGGISLFAWTFSAYLLASTVSVPMYGKLADIYGRKKVFMTAVSLFLLGSLLCGISQNMEQLILSRVVQGIGAGGIQPLTMTILGDIYTMAERGRIQGLISLVWTVSGFIGPAVGGLLTEHVTWRAVFLVNVPACLLAMTMIGLFLHEKLERKKHSIDFIGAALLSVGVVSALFALDSDFVIGGTVIPDGLLYAVAVGFLGTFVWLERRVPEPLVPLAFFKNRVIVVCTLASLAGGVAWNGMAAYVPSYVQGVMGTSPTMAGFVLTFTSVGWPIGSTVMGRTIMRYGLRTPAVVGALMTAIGFVMLRFTPVEAGPWATAAICAFLGLGMGAFVPLTTIAVQNAVGWDQRGAVTGLSLFSRSMGGSVGIAIAGSIMASAAVAATQQGLDPNVLLSGGSLAGLSEVQVLELRQALSGALQNVFLLFAGAALLGALAATQLSGERPKERHEVENELADQRQLTLAHEA